MKFIRIFLLLYILVAACDSPVGLKKGKIAPDFRIPDLRDQAIQLSSLKGKVVLIHFWTDFCKSCRAEFPKIEEFYSSLKSKDFELLAINVGQSKATSLEFQKEFSASFPMLADTRGLTKDLYQIEAFPTNYFINPEGKIIRRITGWVDQKQVEVIIDQNKRR